MSEPTYAVKLKTHQAPQFASLLRHFAIELTERCNNACIHCYINQPEHDTKTCIREMDNALVKDILWQAAELGCLTVCYTGGEPLLREDFTELYLFARRLGMRVALFTNARLITSDLAQLFARIPPGENIEVTVYGMHAESYDAVTCAPGSFFEFMRGVELLRENKIPFIVKQSILPPNRSEMAEFEAFAATLPQMDKKPSYTMNFELRARRDNPEKNRFIRTLRRSPVETTAILARNSDFVSEMREFAGKFMRPPGDRLFDCGAGLGTCVDAYGNAQMCMGLRHPEMVYNLRKLTKGDQNGSPLRIALSEFFPPLRGLRATNPEYLQRCACCFLKGLCEQCPAKSWQEHGTLDTPVEYLCQVAHAQAVYLGLLEAGEQAWELKPEVWKNRLKHFVNSEEGR